VHKLPAVSGSATATLKPVLAAIGLSYIFLRTVEYLRAIASGTHQGLGLSDTVNYLIPFHMLAAGPVMAFTDFRQQPVPAAALTRDDALAAFERIARGLFKKFVLANGLIETVFLTDFKTGGAYLFFEVQMYYLFIYLDFSAYTDIAIGIGRLLGVATPENFNKPLGARNIVVFWERWHISLSQFVRRNLFIPVQLAGMRWTQGRHARLISSIAFGVSFVLVGLWHGLSLRFLLWGAGHALALITCNLYRDWLTARLGRKGAKAFSAHPVVHVAATVLTFEFVAFSLAFLAHPVLAFLG
jgi:alginate O-acetyltransferase complex protein AlgI